MEGNGTAVSRCRKNRQRRIGKRAWSSEACKQDRLWRQGPKSIEANAKTAVLLPGAISINPLNWKLDDTYAPASENKGSLMKNSETGKYEITDVGADAQVLPDRGVVLTHARMEPLDAETEAIVTSFFGPDGRHDDDYSYYFNNIRENVAKRIATYQAGR